MFNKVAISSALAIGLAHGYSTERDSYGVDRDGAGHSSSSSSGYGAPTYNAPAASYSPPATYGAPSTYDPPAASYSSPPSYGGGGDVVDLTPIIIGLLVLTGLSLLFPTAVTLTSVRRRRSVDGTQGKTLYPAHLVQPFSLISVLSLHILVLLAATSFLSFAICTRNWQLPAWLDSSVATPSIWTKSRRSIPSRAGTGPGAPTTTQPPPRPMARRSKVTKLQPLPILPPLPPTRLPLPPTLLPPMLLLPTRRLLPPMIPLLMERLSPPTPLPPQGTELRPTEPPRKEDWT